MNTRVLFHDLQIAANIKAPASPNRGIGMDSVTPIAPKLFTLEEGMSAKVISKASSSGSAILYGVDGKTPSAPASIAASTASQVGPFKGTRQMLITAIAGSIDVYIEDAVLSAGQCTVYGTGLTGSTSYALPGTGYAFTAGQWYRDGTAIANDTGLTHLHTQPDEGKVITFVPTNPTYKSNGILGVAATITAPGKPTTPTMSAIAGGVRLAWSAGAANGGVIDRNEWLDINGNTVVLTTSPQDITGLAQTPYTGTVRSRNSLGTYGAWSDQAAQVTPLGASDVTPPTLTTAIVTNASPTIVLFGFSEPLDQTVALLASAFGITGHTVASVAYASSTSIAVTVSAAFVNGEAARTASYTLPVAANRIKDVAGNLLAAISAQAITNNVQAVGDTTAPTVASAAVSNGAPTQLVLTMSETMAATVPAAGSFAITTSGTAKTVSSLTVSSNLITLTLSSAVANGETLTVAYTKPGSNPAADAAGNQLDTFTGRAVTNNVAAAFRTASVATRSDMPVSLGQFGVNPYINHTVGEHSAIAATDIQSDFWNSTIIPGANGPYGEEVPGISPVTVALSYISGVSGDSSLDQSAGTLTRGKFTDIVADIAGRVRHLDGAARTYAQFIAAGGSVSSDGYRATVPPAWGITSDKCAAVIAAGAWKYNVEYGGAPQVVFAVTSAGTYPANTDIPVSITSGVPVINWTYQASGTGIAASGVTGDYLTGTIATYMSAGIIRLNKAVTIAAAAQALTISSKYPTTVTVSNSLVGDAVTQSATQEKCVHLKNWSTGSVSGVTSASGSSYSMLHNIYGTAVANSTKVVALAGNSIVRGNHDATTAAGWGDANNAVGPLHRAFNIQNWSVVRVAVSGSAPTSEVSNGGNYGNFMRRHAARFCTHLAFGHVENIRSLPWAGAVGTGFLATMRAYTLQMRAALLNGDGPVLTTTALPQATGTFATAAGQVVSAGTIDSTGSTMMWRAYVNNLNSGNRNRSLGDPDFVVDITPLVYSVAPAAGFDSTGVSLANGLWPYLSTWVASGFLGTTLEGTHEQGPMAAALATPIAALLPNFAAVTL